MRFSPEAERRLKRVPFPIRVFVKRRALREAEARGLDEVTTELLDELKNKEHPKG
ncbi:MAG: hypothetical protein GXP55_06005 [Deltaproteobacteria bacterium]|nr:hypothetical protein [Deltaproteobacteria bacterium]